MLLLLALLASAAPAPCTNLSPAQVDYARGQALQERRQWTEAIQAYQEALKADPHFVYAYKSMGTVYYDSGDPRSALACFDLYLHAKPDDDATRAFADTLRRRLSSDTSPEAAAAAAHREAVPTDFRRGLDIGADLGLAFAQANDLNQSLPAASGASYGSSEALALDLNANFGFEGGAVLGCGLLLGPNRSHSLSGGTPGLPGTITVSSLGLFVDGGYRQRLSRDSWLDGRVSAGVLSSQIGISGSASSPSGNGLMVWPQLTYNVALTQQWVADFGGGYMASAVTPDNAGKAVSLGGNRLTLDSGGFTLRVGVSYFFSSPLM
jgi:hypothetical protein